MKTQKIKILVLPIILALLFFSCSKSNEEVSSSVNQLQINGVLNNNNQDLQRITYNMLTSEDKLNLWRQKLENCISDENLNDEQRELVLELKTILIRDYFEEVSNDNKEYFKNIYVVDYLERIQVAFTREQINSIFYRLYGNSLEFEDKKCDCNLGSIFGCGASDDCKAKTCTSIVSGCGFLWAWDCDGLCRLYL